MANAKVFLNWFCIYVKNQGKSRARFYYTADGIAWYENIQDAIDEANNIYTGEQEVRICQRWETTAGRTGEDAIITYSPIK